ncbi:MAG: tRNA (adenosine(37)-N6)-dimethylallyltransferase MiaA [Patescibacteria group bacterium]
MKPKVLVIVGPTASGKSALAVKLAKRFKGEIISADSRQVYRGMNIGTGKITKKEMGGVPHHLLNVASPKNTFTVAKYKKLAEQAIKKILKRDKLPIIVGGTGFYIQSIVDNVFLPEVPPNKKLRENLEKKSTAELFKILKKYDPKRAKTIDANNPRRLVRAIEIAKSLGQVPSLNKKDSLYEFLQIGIRVDLKKLEGKIEKRLLARIKRGMVAEVKKLKNSGLSWQKLDSFGLEYRYIARYLQGQLSKPEMIQQLKTAILKYAKRQMTWFKKDKRIVWIEKLEQSEKLTKNFLLRSLSPK